MAVEHGTRAVRLSPNDPQRFSVYCALLQAHFFAGRYDQAIAFTQAAARDHPKYLLGRCIGAASAALAGRSAEAQKAMVAVRQLDPTLRISNLRNLQPFRRPEDFARWEDALRLAGLPE